MNETLRNQLQKERETGLSLSQIRLATGYSQATISQYLSGSYKGNIQKLERAIASFLQGLAARRAGFQGDLPFCRTSVANRLMQVADICRRDGAIGLCVGESGLGKTRSVRQYAAEHPEVVIIDGYRHYRTKDVMADLHAALGGTGSGTIQKLFKECCKRLQDSGRLIIIDEAESLNVATLDLFRRLNDFAGCGILYVGLPRFRDLLENARGQYEYIVNRIAVPTAVQPLTEADTRMLVETLLPSANGLCPVFHKYARQNGRRLRNLLNNSIRTANHNGGHITDELIIAVARELTV